METIKRAGICALLTGTMLTAMLSGCGEKKADGTAAALTIGGETVNIGGKSCKGISAYFRKCVGKRGRT